MVDNDMVLLSEQCITNFKFFMVDIHTNNPDCSTKSSSLCNLRNQSFAMSILAYT